MGKTVWSNVRQSKFFYAVLYRRMLMMLWVSLVLNIALSLGVYYFYFQRPPHTFYASNGVTQPIKLTPRMSPNYSTEAILPPEPKPDEPAKVTL